jgi:dihydroorotase-like cyclic amidohydrolase
MTQFDTIIRSGTVATASDIFSCDIGIHALAEGKCHIDTSFHLIISDPTEHVLGQELPGLVADGYTSFQVFMTDEGLALADREILEGMSVVRETGALVMVHAENYDVRAYRQESNGR